LKVSRKNDNRVGIADIEAGSFRGVSSEIPRETKTTKSRGCFTLLLDQIPSGVCAAVIHQQATVLDIGPSYEDAFDCFDVDFEAFLLII
jgi:hypothetical protein